MSGRCCTYYSVDHIERLTRSLYQILKIDLGRPIPMGICLIVVRAGLSLFRKNTAVPGTYSGHPWSTSAALNCLAGRGFLFEPRAALAAIQKLEARHIIDRRRIEHRSSPRQIDAVDDGGCRSTRLRAA